MGLRLKFNLILLLVFATGMAGAGYVSWRLLQDNARDEVVRNAELLMEMAVAVRSYTVGEVKPQLELQLMRTFLPQSVPAYAATETLGHLREKYPDYGYKEAALNPTNPRDRAADWEADLINELRRHPDVTERSGVRETPSGPSLYIVRPIKITNPACLVCHSTPGAAPASMIKKYGEANGFGWNLNEIIGAQVVSVPMTVPFAAAQQIFKTFTVAVGMVFAALFLVLNLVLSLFIIRPVTRLSRAAEQVSTGDFSPSEFPEQGRGEIARLGHSFNLMRRSLQKAMQLIDS